MNLTMAFRAQRHSVKDFRFPAKRVRFDVVCLPEIPKRATAPFADTSSGNSDLPLLVSREEPSWI